MINKKIFKKPLLLVACHSVPLSASAEVKLPSFFASNMVLQRNSEVTFWGMAVPKSKVSVNTSWDGQYYEIRSDGDGNLKLKVKTPEAGGPYRMDFSDGMEVLRLENIYIYKIFAALSVFAPPRFAVPDANLL